MIRSTLRFPRTYTLFDRLFILWDRLAKLLRNERNKFPSAKLTLEGMEPRIVPIVPTATPVQDYVLCVSCPTGGAPSNFIGPEAPPPPAAPVPYTANPVRYADGINVISATDIETDGFGDLWSQARTWSSNASYAVGSDNGNGWVDGSQLRITLSGNTLTLISNAATAAIYIGQGTPDENGNFATSAPQFTVTDEVTYDSTHDQYVVPDGSGGTLRFNGFGSSWSSGEKGALASETDADGAVTQVVSWNEAGEPTEVQRSGTQGGVTVTESYLYTYLSSGDNAGLLATVTLRREVGSDGWNTVQEVDYQYYDGTTDNGNLGDLERVTIKDADGDVLSEYYYRYYTSTVYTGGIQTGYQGGLEYVVDPDAYAQLMKEAGGTDADVDSASNATVSTFADNYFQYDSSQRVTEEIAAGQGCSLCSEGQGTYTFAYTSSGNTPDFNNWQTKTVVGLPDGSTEAVYTNGINILDSPGHPV